MFIYSKNNSVINTDNLCNFNVNGKKIEFYFTAMTARENWHFDTEEEAEKTFKEVCEKLNVK